MTLADKSSPAAAAVPPMARARALVERLGPVRSVAFATVLGIVVVLLPVLVSTFWLQIATSVAIYSIVALSLALLIGRVGLVSLNQIALLAVGGWIALRLGFGTSLPFPVLLLATGVITGVIGTLIGLPALRLSGLYLALITLMAAAAITLALQATNFPNGGSGFLGYSPHAGGSAAAAAGVRWRVLPGRGRRDGADVPDRGAPRARQGGPGVGGHPAEPADGDRGRRERDAVQAVGVRAGVVHDRRRGRPARGVSRRADHVRLPDAGFDHAAGGRPDGRRLQLRWPDRGRAAAQAAARAAEELGPAPRPAHDPVRHRRAPGDADRAGRAG